jgi:signal transduction histidine kinase
MYAVSTARIKLIDIALFPLYRAPRDAQPARDVLTVIRKERLREMLRPLAFINLAIGSAVVARFSASTPMVLTLGWFIPIVVMTAYQLFLTVRFKPASPPTANPRALTRAAWSSLTMGVWWALPALMFEPDKSTTDTFLLYLPLGMACGLTVLLTCLPVLAARFILGILVILITSCILRPPGLPEAAAALMLLASCAYCALFAEQLFVTQVKRGLELAEKARVASETLTLFPGAITHFKPDGSPLFSNKLHERVFPSLRLADIDVGVEVSEIHVGSMKYLRTVARNPIDGSVTIVHTDITEIRTARSQADAAQAEAKLSASSLNDFLETTINFTGSKLQLISTAARGLQLPDFNVMNAQALRSLGLIENEANEALALINDLRLTTEINHRKLFQDYSVDDLEAKLRERLVKLLSSSPDLAARVTFIPGAPLFYASYSIEATVRALELLTTRFMAHATANQNYTLSLVSDRSRFAYFLISGVGPVALTVLNQSNDNPAGHDFLTAQLVAAYPTILELFPNVSEAISVSPVSGQWLAIKIPLVDPSQRATPYLARNDRLYGT